MPAIGSVTATFNSTRNFQSCFEYRTDGNIPEQRLMSGTSFRNNYNSLILDGMWPFVCQNNNTSSKMIQASEYVEIRMVFGAEGDERFDWTRFDVLFNRTAEITSPGDGEVVSGNVSFDATLNDKDGNDNVQWAVRKGTCAAGTNTVIGNVDGFSSPYTWAGGATFNASANTSTWVDGNYCFIFNPTESAGDTAIRLTREFIVNNTPDNKDQCKKDGWKLFNLPFKNQGDCVSFVATGGKNLPANQ